MCWFALGYSCTAVPPLVHVHTPLNQQRFMMANKVFPQRINVISLIRGDVHTTGVAKYLLVVLNLNALACQMLSTQQTGAYR